jgi:predicted alpha/beta superfamily hydrolase
MKPWKAPRSKASKGALSSFVAFAAGGLVSAFATASSASPSQMKPAPVTVTVKVTVPRHFRQVSEVHVSGSTEALGKWDGVGITLPRDGSGYTASFTAAAGESIPFKVTLGDWQHAETSGGGGELPDRWLRCQSNCTIYAKVENFRLAGNAFHPVPNSASTDVQYRHEIHSDAFGNDRSLAIYLPPSYGERPDARYPVVYALDGQNLFDVATANSGVEWRLDETMDRLIAAGDVPETIVVGIYATHEREQEYNHCAPAMTGDDSNAALGQADAYARFILDTVKPLIDREFRTRTGRDDTSLLGSSFGGNFGLYAAFDFAAAFSRFGAMSPALWWADYCYERQLPLWTGPLPKRLWIDMGDREGWDDGAVFFRPGVQDVARLYDDFLGIGMMPETQIAKWTHEGAVHNEASWGARVDRVLRFILN